MSIHHSSRKELYLFNCISLRTRGFIVEIVDFCAYFLGMINTVLGFVVFHSRKLLVETPGEVLIFVLLLLLTACQGRPGESDSGSSPSDQRPNVILILTDDQGYGDLGSHGNPWIKTPHLDKFSGEAVEGTNFHVGTTCTPTRAGLMTGRNANRNGAWHTIAGCSILNPEEETMAAVFAGNGYQTAMFGKWHLGDNYPYRPHDRGFQETFYCGGGGVWQTPDYWGNDYFDDTYFRNGQPEKATGYCTDVWFNEAIKYIEKVKKEPFFVYLAPNAAHSPFNVPPKYMNLYKNTPLAPWQQRFYGMVTNLDENFGKLLGYLDNAGLAENTIVIYTTDNGTAGGIYLDKESGKEIGYNAGLKGIKGSQYDGGHRVPFFIRWPEGGLNGGRKTKELLAHVDILPTLAKMTGLSYTPKFPLDGMAADHLLKGSKDTSERMLVIDTQRIQWPEKGRNSCVMSTEWRLVNGQELYNFLDDPGQQRDVAGSYPEQVKKMRQFYEQWWEETTTEWEHSAIPIGNENANPVMITIHDLHTGEGLPWNQELIRRAGDNPDGHYTVSVESDGTYRFRLSRYPPESGLTLAASAPRVEASEFMNGYSEGKALKIRKATVKINENVFTNTADRASPWIEIHAELTSGTTNMTTWFELEDGKRIPAYYNLIEKL